MPPKKVLVIRFSSIGDIVLTTPVIRGLKRQARAEVHYLTSKRFATVLEDNPYIDRLWILDDNLPELLRDLKKEHFDWVIDLHRNLRTLRVKWTLRVPSRSFYKLNLQKWLLVRFGWNTLPSVHIVDRYMDTVKHLGVIGDGKGLDFFLKDEDVDFVKRNIEPIGGPGYLCVALGAAHPTKQIPADKLRQFISNANRPVVLVGGPDESKLGESLAVLDGVVNMAGKATIGQSAAIIAASTMVVTPDTGMMHIAAAFHRPMISVWGNTIPEFGMYAYYGDDDVIDRRAEVAGLPCRPCSKIGFQECPKGHFKCMNQQDPVKWVSWTKEIFHNSEA